MDNVINLNVINEQAVAECAQMLCDALDGPGRIPVPHDVGLAALADVIATSIECAVDEPDRAKRQEICDQILDYVYRRAWMQLHSVWVKRAEPADNVVPMAPKEDDKDDKE